MQFSTNLSEGDGLWIMNPRANTLGLIFRGNYILLEEQIGLHSQGSGVYYRPVGGTT